MKYLTVYMVWRFNIMYLIWYMMMEVIQWWCIVYGDVSGDVCNITYSKEII